MINCIKKSFLLIILFFFSFKLISSPSHNVQEYTLENGLQIFLLEDSTDALIHANFVCKAGFSSQTQETNGFFKLFSRLISKYSPNLTFDSIQCNADSSIYSLSFTPQQVFEKMDILSNALFSCDFTDELLNNELTKLKKEVSENANSLSTYINAAIDSRVFSHSPWKHDSGIYPSLFKKTTEKKARNLIAEISNRWYIPKNCALFIYGNINCENLLSILQNTFGRFYSNSNTPLQKTSNSINKQKKYVFHSDEISEELTQVVVQYTMLNLEECDLLSATLNNNNSTFKSTILTNSGLNIPGGEYIDVSSAFKNNSTRLIIQTLIQNQESNKTNPLEQAQTFLENVQQFSILPEEFLSAKEQLIIDIKTQISNPSTLMEKLTYFWPIQDNYNIQEDDFINYPNSSITSLLESRKTHIQNQELSNILNLLNSQEPFIFIIINSKKYKENKKTFANVGYEEINEKNASWYVQKMYKNINEQVSSENQPYSSQNNSLDITNSYYEKNINKIKTNELSNKIKIISKKNENSSNVSLVLSISGGKLNSYENPGFEEVMINLLTNLIQKEIYKKEVQGIIIGKPTISYKINISTSSIIVNFEKEDTEEVCKAISNAIIFGEISPADADRAVLSCQFQKRLENGSVNCQLLSATYKSLYGDNPISRIFDTEKEILQQTNYTSILESYPSLLNANKFTIIISGCFDDEIFSYLEKSFCLLTNKGSDFTKKKDFITSIQNFPSQKLSIKVRHTFLTDIPAEEAGPQPAILIPTKEFLDPVIYLGESPVNNSKISAIYNAMLNYIGRRLQNYVDDNKNFSNNTVSIQLPQNHINLGMIIITNVKHTKEADVAYRTTVQKIKDSLLDAKTFQNTIQEIKNLWVITQMESTSTNNGTALLIQRGLEMFPEEPKPEYYLEEYNHIQSADVQDFLNIMEYFPQRAQIRVYSSDSKN